MSCYAMLCVYLHLYVHIYIYIYLYAYSYAYNVNIPGASQYCFLFYTCLTPNPKKIDFGAGVEKELRNGFAFRDTSDAPE